MPASPVDAAIWLFFRQRWFTSAGNQVAVPVTLGATSLAVTFPRTEVDARYGVGAMPTWLTTVAVTAKSATGCTLSFGTAAPANAAVDVSTFRSE